MPTFTETEATLNAVAGQSSTLIGRVNNMLAAATQLQSDIAVFESKYSAFSTQLDTDAANNSTDANWQDAKAKKDKFVADIVTAKSRIDAMVTALTGL